MPKHTIRGYCHCKAIQYEITHEEDYKPTVMMCHCSHCQTVGGGVGSFNAMFPIDSFKQTSQIKCNIFEDQGGSGNINQRYFCPKCGTPVATLSESRQLAIMKIPTMRDELKQKQFTPVFESFTASKYVWEPEIYCQSAQQFTAARK